MPNVLTLSGSFVKAAKFKDTYVLLCSSGIVFLEQSDLKELGKVTFSGYLTDLYIPDHKDYFFLATSGSGILKCNPPQELVMADLSNTLSYYKLSPQIHSNIINCIDGVNEALVIGTQSGIEVLYKNNSYTSFTLSGVRVIQFAENYDLYYGGLFGLACKSQAISGSWSNPNFILTTSSLPSLSSNILNSISVTTSHNQRIVSLATSSGVDFIRQRSFLEASDVIHFKV